MKGVITYGALLAVLLGVSWSKWTAPEEKDIGDKVVVLEIKADELESIEWTEEKSKTIISRRSDALGTYLWGEHERTKPTPQEQPNVQLVERDEEGKDTVVSSSHDLPAPAEPEIEKNVFKVGADGDKLLESLAPMLALRKLDTAGLDMAKVGLDAPKEKLVITRKGRTTTFEVGGEVYGTKDVYVKNAETGEVYLVDDEFFRPLKFARTRLPDRTLSGIEKAKVAKAVVSGAAGKAEFVQKNRDDAAKASWARAEAPDEAAEQVNTWMEQLLRLKGTTYADPAKPPEGLEPMFQVTLADDAGKSETIEVFREGAEGDFWAQSEHTRGKVKLLKSATDSLATDVASLMAE